MIENREKVNCINVLYQIDTELSIKDMQKEMKDELKEEMEKLEGKNDMFFEIIEKQVSDENFDISKLSGYEMKEKEYTDIYAKMTSFCGSFNQYVDYQSYKYLNCDGETIFVTINYAEKVSYEEAVKVLSGYRRPTKYNEGNITYELQGKMENGIMIISGENKVITKLIQKLSMNCYLEEIDNEKPSKSENKPNTLVYNEFYDEYHEEN